MMKCDQARVSGEPGCGGASEHVNAEAEAEAEKAHEEMGDRE